MIFPLQAPNFLDGMRRTHIYNSLNFQRIHLYSSIGYNETSKKIGVPLQALKMLDRTRRREIYNGLNFQRIHLNSFVRNNESEQSPWIDTKNTLVGIRANLIVSASFKNQTQVIWVIDPLMRMWRQIIKVRFDNGLNIMKGKIHCPLKGCPSIFQSKWH